MKNFLLLLCFCCAFTTQPFAQWTNISTGRWHCQSPASFPSDNVGYIRSVYPCLFKTTDGGATWDSLPLPLKAIDLDFIWDNEGFALLDTGSQSYLAYTTDGGNVWTLHPMPAGQEFTMIQMVNFTDGFACSPGRIYRTMDGGVSWLGYVDVGLYRFNDKDFVGFDTTVFTGEKVVSPFNGAVFSSPDDFNFYAGELTTPGSQIQGSHFVNGGKGLAVFNTNDKNYLVRTTNAGATWDTLLTDTTALTLFTDVFMIDDNESYITVKDQSGALGWVYHVTGATYTSDLPMTPLNMYRLYRGGNTLFAVGQQFVFKLNTLLGAEEQVTELKGIFPNPATNEIFIPVTGPSEVSLLDMSGKVVLVQHLGAGSPLSLTTVDNGSYIVRVNNSSGMYSGKIVVSR